MPHIVHLTSVHPALDVRIFQKECRSLAQAGYRVTLVAPHTQAEIIDNVSIVPVPRYKRRLVRMLLGPYKVFMTARRLHGDLYHFHDPELLPIGVLLKLTTRARVIYDVHEDNAEQMLARRWMPYPIRLIASFGVRLVEKIAVKFFDALIVVTEHIANLLPHTYTVIVKNYPLLRPELQRLNNVQSYNPDNHQLIYTGGWTNHRGIYQVVQALGLIQTPDTRLVLLGRNVDPEVQTKARFLPGYARVDYRGLVSHHEVFQLMASSAIGLVCNQPQYGYDRSLPTKLFEYMFVGLPVIASRFPAWQEIIEGNQCGLTVDPTRPEEIAQAIDTLLSQPDLRKHMGANGRKAVLNKYNWKFEGQKLLNLYKDLLNQC